MWKVTFDLHLGLIFYFNLVIFQFPGIDKSMNSRANLHTFFLTCLALYIVPKRASSSSSVLLAYIVCTTYLSANLPTFFLTLDYVLTFSFYFLDMAMSERNFHSNSAYITSPKLLSKPSGGCCPPGWPSWGHSRPEIS